MVKKENTAIGISRQKGETQEMKASIDIEGIVRWTFLPYNDDE